MSPWGSNSTTPPDSKGEKEEGWQTNTTLIRGVFWKVSAHLRLKFGQEANCCITGYWEQAAGLIKLKSATFQKCTRTSTALHFIVVNMLTSSKTSYQGSQPHSSKCRNWSFIKAVNNKLLPEMLKDYWIQQRTGVAVKISKFLCGEGVCSGQREETWQNYGS